MARKVPISFDRYYKYDEIMQYLNDVVTAYPQLASLESIGKSYEKREIPALTLTDRKSGAPENKSALYVEANIHAGEVTGSMTALNLIDLLLSGADEDVKIQRLLEKYTFYILPRVNPDGAEYYLTTPNTLRSSVRPWPELDMENLPGLHPQDIDGNGMILQMRLRDDKRGAWKISKRDARLLLPREPWDSDEAFYRLLPEGLINNYNGEPFEVVRSPFNLDMNRNFPSNWNPGVQGGGDYPTSEPEVRGVVEFITAHPNIALANSYHTSGGIFFRNPYQYGDEAIDAMDLKCIRAVAAEGTKVTGYPDVKSSNRACLPEWLYEHKGVIGFTTELWDRIGQAGIDRAAAAKAATPEEKEEIQIRLLQWNDRVLAGAGFCNWQTFAHPQLGSVEIGGWDPKYNLQNPPTFLLAGETYKNALWAIREAACLPHLCFDEIKQEKLDDKLWKITAAVINDGFLPTNITNKALSLKAVKPDSVSLEGAEILNGKKSIPLGNLQGYANAHFSGGWGPAVPTSLGKAAWLVKAAAGDQITLTARSVRGGKAVSSFYLSE
ncbi:MAG: M14 family metallopeptidase [Negativicutes bacterium]|nr:M14 family metallopeptidase [Negativicutes bacterium]